MREKLILDIQRHLGQSRFCPIGQKFNILTSTLIARWFFVGALYSISLSWNKYNNLPTNFI